MNDRTELSFDCHQVDFNGNGRIDYNEFVAATMKIQVCDKLLSFMSVPHFWVAESDGDF